MGGGEREASFREGKKCFIDGQCRSGSWHHRSLANRSLKGQGKGEKTSQRPVEQEKSPAVRPLRPTSLPFISFETNTPHFNSVNKH